MFCLVAGILLKCVFKPHGMQFGSQLSKGGATNLKVGGGGQCIGRWGINTVKTLKFEKGGGA